MKNREFINKIREEIKTLEEKQRFLKNQRKTVKLVGERKMSSYDAAEELRHTSYPLFIKYIVYYIFKHRRELPTFVDSTTRKDYRGNPVKVVGNVEEFTDIIKRCCGEKCWVLSEEWNSGYWHQLDETAYKVLDVAQEWINKYKDEYKADMEKVNKDNQQSKRLYVLVDKSLDPVYACVQGGHAVAQYLIEHPDGPWKNETLVYLYADVSKWKYKLEFLQKDFSVFYEPDLDNKLTALSVVDDTKLFKSLNTVKV